MKYARFLGFDVSTTAVSVGVMDGHGGEDFAAIPMTGATLWHEQSAFEPNAFPVILAEVLIRLSERGWIFAHPGQLCASVRQHDMVLLGKCGSPLIPFLTWQCHAASKEVEALRASGAEALVGRIEPRFILPKLMWALAQEPALRSEIAYVLTTGDYMTWMLTGRGCVSTSDALSNGLLLQDSKQLASNVIGPLARLDPKWFLPVVQSGQPCGRVVRGIHPGWGVPTAFLRDWTVHAPLGDNHAGAVGSGLDDDQTLVISFGTSGTVVRKCGHDARLCGRAASFEYFSDRLLLMMLADCAVWYDRFVKAFAGMQPNLHELNELAAASDVEKWMFVHQVESGGQWQEVYPEGWGALGMPEKVASTQSSIVVYMLRLVRDLLAEVKSDTPPITKFVLTGGLSQSPLLQHVIAVGLNELVPGCSVQVSAREGPLANKAAVLGALFTAMVGTGEYPDLSSVIKRNCALRPVAASVLAQAGIERFIARNL